MYNCGHIIHGRITTFGSNEGPFGRVKNYFCSFEKL